MASPTTREQFKAYCLRKLGHPVIEVNVSDEQAEDRIDEALKYWNDYHFDGSEKVYYKYQVTQQDKDNKYIDLPDNIMGTVSIFDFGSSISTRGIFDIKYQFALNDLYTLTSAALAPYYYAMTNLALIQEIMVGKQPIRFNRHRNRLHIDMNWDRVNVGDYLIVEAYQVVGPDEFPDVWGDRWLQNYATAKIKYQWAWNLSKFIGMNMPGNIQFNADRMMDEAKEEIAKMEEEMLSSFSLPVSDMIG